jgi:hypothetical protein
VALCFSQAALMSDIVCFVLFLFVCNIFVVCLCDDINGNDDGNGNGAPAAFDWRDNDFFFAIQDDVVPSSDLPQLIDDARAIGNQYRTYWIDSDASTRSTVDSLGRALTRNAIESGCVPQHRVNDISGIEFWVKTIRLNEKGLDFHGKITNNNNRSQVSFV